MHHIFTIVYACIHIQLIYKTNTSREKDKVNVIFFLHILYAAPTMNLTFPIIKDYYLRKKAGPS